MTAGPHVLIIGAGLGGLCLAQGLTRAGISVAVYERDANAGQFRGQGYRIGLKPTGAQALRDCLPAPLFELCVATSTRPASRMVLLDEQLRPTLDKPLPHDEPGMGRLSVNRLTLREILLTGLDDVVHFGRTFEHFELAGTGQVRAHFADGSTATGDLLVGADGTDSVVRGQLLPGAELDELHWSVYGRTPITDGLLDQTPAVLVDTFNRMKGPAGAEISIATCRALEPARRATARLVPEAVLTEIPDHFSWTTPLRDPDQAADAAALHRAATEAVAGFHPAVRRIVAEADVPATFPVLAASARPAGPWSSAVVTLLGDAIHIMSPGRGDASIALQDAALLCRVLRDIAAGRAERTAVKTEYEAEMLRYAFETGAREFGPSYARTPVWDIDRPQDAFTHLAEQGALRGRALDVGCGTGEHALLCAARGLDAIGIDIEPEAIAKAQRKAAGRGLPARFLVGDAVELAEVGDGFDTVLDCGFFHCLSDEERGRFATALRGVMAPGGHLYLLCLSDRQPGSSTMPRRIRQDEIRSSFRDGWMVVSIEPARLALTRNPDGVHAWLAAIAAA